MYIVYLVATDLSDITGGVRVILEHVNRLSERGHRVEIWVMDEIRKPYFRSDVPIFKYDESRLLQPDIVVMTDLVFLPVLKTKRKKGLFILLQHDNEWVSSVSEITTFSAYLTEYKQFIKKGGCTILVVSSWLQKIVKEKYGLNSELIRNGVDHKMFHPTYPSNKTDDPSVLVIYDPQDWKGFPESIHAILEARKRINNLRVMIIGRYFPRPIVPAVNFGFLFPATFYNRPLQEDLQKIYSSATVFIFASWQEGFGLPGLEAMACGTALVSTDSGGVRDYAVPDKTAIIIPPKDIQAMSKAIINVIEHKKPRDKLIENGLNMVKTFDWDVSISKLEELFIR